MKSIVKIKTVFIILNLFAFILLAACTDNDSNNKIDNNIKESNNNIEKIYCPLDHAILESEINHPPIMVAIDNMSLARPQSGLDNADIVYEIPAEGGVSRFLAVFYHDIPDEIGPVRSARPYFIDLAKELNAVFVHAGGSQDALNYLAKGTINSINEFAYGKYFRRDKSRYMPHNLYTSSDKLLQILELKDWNEKVEITPFKFMTEDEVMSGEVVIDKIEIDYPSAHNIYQYDSEKNRYSRFIKDEPHCDRVTGEQLCAVNIIVQYITSKVLDSEGRLAIDLTGEGKALLFSRGHVYEGKWLKEDLDTRTIFYDDSGEEWILSPGQTWIQVVDQNVKIAY